MSSDQIAGHTALRPVRAMADRGERRFNWVSRAQVLPVGHRKIVKRQQGVAILGQTHRRLRILRFVSRDELVKGRLGILARGRLPDLMQSLLCLRLHRLGHRVQHVSRLMYPATLRPRPRRRVDLFQCRPESQRAIARRQLRNSGPNVPKP